MNDVKKLYDNIWKFQIEWVAKLPWVEVLVAKGGFIHIAMRCKVYSLIQSMEKIVGCKWDTLTKIRGVKLQCGTCLILGWKTQGEYIVKEFVNLKNMKLYN
jgi:hypothetical protein